MRYLFSIKNLSMPFCASLLLTFLYGCNDNNLNNVKVLQNTADKRPTINPNVGNTPTHVAYASTLAEGIDFKREGYPTFIARTTGISERESFGRWSNGDEIVLEFNNPLPSKFIISIRAAAFMPNINKPFKMIIGDVQQEFIIDSGSPEKMKDILIPFKIKGEAKLIRIQVPQATSPKTVANSVDERRLGIALERLQIVE